jgi:hypothetical protein
MYSEPRHVVFIRLSVQFADYFQLIRQTHCVRQGPDRRKIELDGVVTCSQSLNTVVEIERGFSLVRGWLPTHVGVCPDG